LIQRSASELARRSPVHAATGRLALVHCRRVRAACALKARVAQPNKLEHIVDCTLLERCHACASYAVTNTTWQRRRPDAPVRGCQSWHLNVQKDDVGREPVELLQRLKAIPRLADNAQFGPQCSQMVRNSSRSTVSSSAINAVGCGIAQAFWCLAASSAR